MKTGTMHDVIVVGSGPAGSIVGRQLAAEGIDVLLLDRARFPRYKTCGGGITGRTLKRLGSPLPASVVENATTKLTLTLHGRQALSATSAEPFILMTMRDHLDTWLVRAAVEAGATWRDDTRVQDVTVTEDGVAVETSRGVFRAAVLVGADGVHSAVARHLGLAGHHRKALALEVELEVVTRVLDEFDHRIHIDYGPYRHGYAWVFPKRDHLSVGALSTAHDGRRLQRQLDQFLSVMRIEGTPRLRRGYYLSIGGQVETLQWGRAIVVGDAAGLVDPMLGEGIYYAVWSGQLAATAISQAFNSLQGPGGPNVPSLLGRYEEAVHAEITPELQALHYLHTAFYAWPAAFHSLLSHRRGIVEGLPRVLRGEATFDELVPPLRWVTPGLWSLRRGNRSF